MRIYHYYGNEAQKRLFVFPFVMELGLLIGLIISYVFVIKEIIEERKNKKSLETTIVLCEDEKTRKKIGENVMKSGVLQKNFISLNLNRMNERDDES